VYSPAAGSIPAAGSDTLSVSFTPTDTTDYTNASATVALAVSKVTPTLSWATPGAITFGTALSAAQLNATASVPGTFSYSPAAGTTPAAGTDTLSVTFTPTDSVDYNTATASVSLTVNQPAKTVPTITWAAPASISYGTALSAAQLNATASVPGTFVYSPAAGSMPSAGTDVLSVTFTPTDTTDYTTATASVSLIVGKATPALTWATPAAISFGTALSGAQLNATASVPGTFVYNPAAGTTPAAGSDTLSVTFTPTDSTDYNTATANVSLTVNQANKTVPAITWAAPAAISYGTALSAAQLNATASVPGTFVYSPAAGTVLTAGSDTLSVAFTPTDTTTYTNASATVNLVVSKATPTLSWSTPAAITSGAALSAAQLNATASVPGTFVYTPAAGTTPAVGNDMLSVTFTPTDTTDYNTATASVSLTVNQAAKTVPTITWAAPAAVPYGTALSTAQLNATASVPGTFVYSPAEGSTPVAGSDTLSVTFTPTDTTDYTTATASVSLTVNKVTPTISWATPAAITSGTALSAAQLNATASVPGTFVYSPAAGTTPAAGTDTLSVTFTPTDSTDYNTATANVSLTVNQANKTVPTITWAAPAAISYGTAISAAQLNATASVPGTFLYSPAAGTVPAAGTDTLSVTFTPTDTTDYTNASATVSLVVNKITPTITWANPAAMAYGMALSAAQLNATASVAGTFVYTPAAGTFPAAGTDILSVTFTPTDTTDYSTATATVSVTVGKVMPTITWTTPAGISYGTALSAAQLNATASVPGTFVYSPTAGTTPSAGSDTLSVTFTPTDTTDYSTATATVSLTVGKVTPTITWATPAAITSGTALSAAQLNATASVAGTFVYSPALGTTPAAGSDTLSVTFTPADTTDYTTATANVILTVNQPNKTIPTITWAAPASVPYGTVLSAAQLNATASVAGTFVYSPAAGTKPLAGTDTLSVTFTPTDTTDYTNASATVSLVVNKVSPTLTWTAPAGISYGTALSAVQLNATASVPGTFVYNPAAGTTPAAGTDTLSVTFTPTDATDYSTATATVSLAVGKVTPTLTWATPAAISYGTALSATQLNATASVPGTFAYSPAAGTTPAAGNDTLSVTFTPADAADYATATATVSLTVNKATPTITWATPAAITSGTALSATQLNATASVPGTFVYSPAAGTTPAAGSDTLSVTFTPTDTTDYTTATASVTLTVNQPNKTVPTITWATPAAVSYGTTLSAAQLNATASVAGTFVYSPAAGSTPATGTDTLSVTFTPTDTTDYTTATATVSLVVNKVTPTITWATPAGIPYGTALSSTQLNATASVAGTFVYSPAAGTTPATGTDTLSVTFTPTDTTDYATATATVSLVVGKVTPTIIWANPAAITYGTALSAAQLNATASVPGTFVYSPAAGTTPLAGPDTLSVTFTPTDTTDYTTKTATVSLTVNKVTPTVTWATPAAITLGTTLSGTQLNATASVPGTFVYTPALGTAPAAGSDTLSVTFTPTDSTDYSTVTATVSLTVSQPNKTVPTITWATPAAVSYGTALSATQLNATASVAGTFVYSPAAGTIPATGTDTLSVTFTPTDTTDYTNASATVSLVVNKVTPTITWAAPAAITYGTTLSATQLNATASVPGTFVYTPASGSTPLAGTDTLSVTFTPTDTTDYATATATVNLTVNKATPTITWATPAAVSYGTTLSAAQLDATASIPGTFVYSPAAGSTPAVGTDTLSVTFTPTDTTDYTTKTATVSLTVNKGTPTITWAAPAGITYGTALSATQLDATASVAGTFVYSPAAGTILAAGTDTLSVTFTPTDTTDYSTATATVSLAVSKVTPTISWATPAAITSGTALSATQLNATASVPGTFVYSPAAGSTPGVGTDTLSVTFTPTDAVDYNTATATVSLTVNAAPKTTPTINWATPAAITYGTTLSATQLNATASVVGTFVYSPAAGTTPAPGTDTLSVTFTPTDTTDYNTATATVSLTVNKATPTITWATPASVASGTALSATQLDATASVAGTFVYNPAAGTTMTAGTHTLSVTFTPTNTTDYTTATATVSLVVGKTTPTITWATPAAITYGTTLSSTQLNATASVAGTFVYSPTAGTTLTAGSHTLSVTFTPTDTTDYNTATATVTLTVNQATPTVTWATPASIASGTSLSSTQLDATASVAGTFVYTPSSGAVPAAGTDTLSVTFTPTDSTDYKAVTATVSLVVTGGTAPVVTNINIGTTVTQTGMKRLGMNIANQTSYDSGQMLRNLTFINPGFEAETWQSILHCVTVTPTSCTDSNIYAVWPANFLQGATFQFIYGGANGETGTVTTSLAANYGANQGVTINFPALATPPLPGDFVVVKMSVPGNGQDGWWTSIYGGAAITTETTDISPNSPGKQALSVSATGSGQSASVTSYFDSYGGRSFVQLNGSYQISFRAKPTGGNNQVTVTVLRNASTGNEVFFNQTITLASGWQDYTYTFNAAENGTSIGTAYLQFYVAGASIYLDDAALTEAAAPTNPTPFRNAVVSTLQALQPGVMRYNDAANMGSSIDNVLAVPFARMRAGVSEQATDQAGIELGLHEFLQLCQTVGSEPYYNMPTAMSPQEMTNLMEYLAGPSTSTYGAIRAARGQVAPWTSVFPKIHLELGNEEWNSIFPGWNMQDPVAYGNRAGTIFTAAKQSPYYSANAGIFDMVMGSWAVVPWYTGQETANSSNYDSVSVAPYIFNSFNDASSNEAIFGPMFAQPESIDSVSSGYMYQQAQAGAAANTNVVIYEVQLSTLQGSANQSQVNSAVPSVAAGLTVSEHMLLMMRDLGIKTQNIWALPEYVNPFTNTSGGSETSPLFGSVIDMGGQTNLKRPVFLAAQLSNTAILPTMLGTSVTGPNPTWNQPLSTNDSIQLDNAHELQTFAFSDGAYKRSVIVFNLSRTTALPITFSGANAPTGTVGVGLLTSANITDNNENSGVVNIVNSTLTNFSSTTQVSLPPFSMTVLTWQAP
jgi:alpha-L-arabinofuranosidase